MLHFYDFEVFMEDWLVVIINPILQKKTVIVNNEFMLMDYYDQYKNDIFIGYNSNNYDQYIFKGLLLGKDPKYINDAIIVSGAKGYTIDRRFRDIQFYNYDVYKKNDGGLKTLEGFMGNSIQETSVPFDIDRKLTDDELKEVINYCVHDVEQTIEVFLQRKNDFDATMELIKTFKLPMSMIGLTHPQLVANILGCKKVERYDEYEFSIVNTIKIEKHKEVIDWFKKQIDYKENLKIEVNGVPHIFGWGGLHGCPDKPLHRKGLLLHVDVTSYYPSLMIEYDFLTRNCSDKNKFKEIYDKRVELKKAGKKKEQAPYKICLNGTFGISKASFSNAFDPRQANNICVNGQLMLLDLLEKLEGHCELIQSNTDGLILQIEDTDEAFNKVDDICYEWEKRTKMSLGFDICSEIWQKDVNNYILKFADGKLERKGGYVKELSELDNDLPIINKAVVDHLTMGVPVEETINNCNELKMFQKIVKVSSKYKFGYHNGKKLNEKTFRVFASCDNVDSYIGKQKTEGATIEKFANTPEHCFIENGNVNGMEVPKKLNKKWYIELAKKRLADFGITEDLQLELF